MTAEVIAVETYGSTAEKNEVIISKEAGVLIKRDGHAKLSIRSSVKKFLVSVFLPQGYPSSVSNDYLEYQLWDTLQAFCSSITSTLATQAVLKGYGVGDEKATVAAATITWMLKDGAGMVGRILFAWLKGSQLDCDAKRWRLHADILNDLAILLDLIAPIFKSCFIYIACLSSVTRSIVGVAGGATRAALTLHQAKRDNMADVSAKDGSQETLVNLMALIAGFILTPLVADKPFLVWILFFIFTFLHLFANYRAVSSVVMETINKPRMFILLERYLKENVVSKPCDVSLVDPVLKSPGYQSKINIGIPLKNALQNVSPDDLDEIISKKPQYMIGLSKHNCLINVAVHQDATNFVKRKSCFHALLLDMFVQNPVQNVYRIECKSMCTVEGGAIATGRPLKIEELLGNFKRTSSEILSNSQLIQETQVRVDQMYPKFEEELKHQGWDLQRCHLGLDEWRFEWDKKLL